MEVAKSVQDRAAARVGSSLRDKYALDALIGVGAAGAVYAGRHRNGMRVAVKVLHPEVAEVAHTRQRFLREGYAANRIGHEGVVRVLDDDETADGTVFLAMELLEGRTLEEEWFAAPERKLGLARTAAISEQVLGVLEAAERAAVVHRDIKPANVFVIARDERIKILDFGLARLLGEPRTTPTGDAIGSAEFTAPEQARGQGRDADARTDIYAVGAMMFSLLSGQFVHASRSALERMILAATSPARSVRAVAPEVGEEVAHVIDIALSFERDTRWTCAAAMRSALAAAMKERVKER